MTPAPDGSPFAWTPELEAAAARVRALQASLDAEMAQLRRAILGSYHQGYGFASALLALGHPPGRARAIFYQVAASVGLAPDDLADSPRLAALDDRLAGRDPWEDVPADWIGSRLEVPDPMEADDGRE